MVGCVCIVLNWLCLYCVVLVDCVCIDWSWQGNAHDRLITSEIFIDFGSFGCYWNYCGRGRGYCSSCYVRFALAKWNPA